MIINIFNISIEYFDLFNLLEMFFNLFFNLFIFVLFLLVIRIKLILIILVFSCLLFVVNDLFIFCVVFGF